MFSLLFPDSPPALATITINSLASCPNSCSGHGTCGAGVCLCTSPYNGVSPDCSLFSLAYDVTVSGELVSATTGALPPPSVLTPTPTAYTLSINASLPQGGMLLVAAGYVPLYARYDAAFNSSLLASPPLVYSPLLPSETIYFTLLPPQNIANTSGAQSFSISVHASWTCPNNCSGNGECSVAGCMCALGFETEPDCSVFDLNLQSNVSASAVVGANEWIYFHMGVTDATELLWDVFTNTSACAEADSPELLQVYAKQNNRPSLFDYDYRSYGVGAERKLEISLGGPRAGEPSVWWLGVASTGAACNVLVTGSATRLCPNDCSNNGLCQAGTCVCVPPFTLDDCSATDVELYPDTPVSLQVVADQLVFFHTLVIGDDALYIRAEELNTQGAVILLARLGSYPSASQFTYRNDSPSALHEILVGATQAAGIWYIAVLGAASLAPPQVSAAVHLSASEGCAAYTACSECSADPLCGWCSADPLNAARGSCVAGNADQPYNAVCDAWLFASCSTASSRHRTSFFGLLIGVGLGSLLILAIAATAYIIYQHWHRSLKEALSGRPGS